MPLETKKLNENINIIKESDCWETPKYAMPMLLEYVPKYWRVWESACGSGRMVRYLEEFGYTVPYWSDLQMGDDCNYFNINYENYDIEITNIPFSIQVKWIEKALSRGKPFAFIIPLKSLEQKMCKLIKDYGLQIISPYQRIAFYTPHEGWYRHNEKNQIGLNKNVSCGYKQKEKFEVCPECNGTNKIQTIKSVPQMKTIWLTWQLNLPERLLLVDNSENIRLYPR